MMESKAAPKPVKILVVSTVPTDNSGLPTVIFNLFSNIDTAGLSFKYISVNDLDQRHLDILKEKGIGYSVIPRKISSPWSYVRNLAKVAKGFDIMHVHGNSATMLLEMTAGKLARVPVRISHNHATDCVMKCIDKAARPFFHRLCTHRLSCGEAAGRFLYGNRDFRIVNNAVDTMKFMYRPEFRDNIRQNLGIDDNCTVIGCVANFIDVKNHTFLLDIFKEILGLRPDSRLLLIGDGELRKDITDKIVRLGISSQVILTGSINNPHEYINAFDIVIMPSLREGMPLSLIEQQANGLKILASANIPHQIDLTGNVTFKSLDDSAQDWAASALSMIGKRDEASSASAIDDIRRNGFDLKKVAQDLKDFYIDCYRNT